MTTSATQLAYDDAFYANLASITWGSARVIVPLVLELVPAKSVVDVGCGLGIWLAVFAENGVTDSQGFDGEYVNRESLQIPHERFTPADLGQPLKTTKQFDLALSLEVAEHLNPRVADQHIDELTRLAPAILFSAAVPGQGGTDHINEQWPEYWAERFAARNYRAVDAVRPQLIRFSTKVAFWYTQNIIMFVKESALSDYPQLQPWAMATRPQSLGWIHPSLYESIKLQLANAEQDAAHWSIEANSAKRSITRLPRLLSRAIMTRCSRLFS